jgi:hypothetical protein
MRFRVVQSMHLPSKVHSVTSQNTVNRIFAVLTIADLSAGRAGFQNYHYLYCKVCLSTSMNSYKLIGLTELAFISRIPSE